MFGRTRLWIIGLCWVVTPLGAGCQEELEVRAEWIREQEFAPLLPGRRWEHGEVPQVTSLAAAGASDRAEGRARGAVEPSKARLDEAPDEVGAAERRGAEERAPRVGRSKGTEAEPLGPGAGELGPGERAKDAPSPEGEASEGRGITVEDEEGEASSVASGSPRKTPVRVDLNRATLEQLQGLPGIGPKTAERIVAYRSRRKFRRVRDLRRIRGIGVATLARLSPLVEVGP